VKRRYGGVRPVDRWRSARAAAIVVGLLLVEHLLMDEVGPPLLLVRALLDLGDAWSGPVASLLAS
jgi:hypothetical protein